MPADAKDKAWLVAGFRSDEIDLDARELTFRRDALATRSDPPKDGERGRPPIFGWAKGMITVLPGTDLTEPADPGLADWIDRKYGPAP